MRKSIKRKKEKVQKERKKKLKKERKKDNLYERRNFWCSSDGKNPYLR